MGLTWDLQRTYICLPLMKILERKDAETLRFIFEHGKHRTNKIFVLFESFVFRKIEPQILGI